MTVEKQTVDLIIRGARIVSMDAQRRIFSNGALAIAADRIVAVGGSKEICAQFDATQDIDGSRFVITPGMINGHIHVTGDPLTRAWLPDNSNLDFAEELTRWVLPRFTAHEPEDEAISAELAAVKMLRTGTTCFLEAGTVQYLDAVVAGADKTGIRGRVGRWVEGRDANDAENERQQVAKAIRDLESEVAEYPANKDARIAAWPLLVGHFTNPDEVWLAAKSIADASGVGLSAHMSPYRSDPEWYLEHLSCRPIEHLAKLGVLGDNLCLTHLTHIDQSELQLLADSQTNVVLCPLAALRGGFGIVGAGRFPEMAAAGINILLGSDGFDPDILRQAQIMSSLFKDVREDATLFPAEEMLAMLTRNGAIGLAMGEQIGALEAGKKADFVCHDIDRPEWQPLIGVVNQLAWLADGRSVHSVWVDGIRVVDNYRCIQIDEAQLYARAAESAAVVLERTGLPFVSPWPVS